MKKLTIFQQEFRSLSHVCHQAASAVTKNVIWPSEETLQASLFRGNAIQSDLSC